MPGSTPEPHTLTTHDQQKLIDVLYQQRLAQDALLATGLTADQKHLLGTIMLTRFEVHAILKSYLTHQGISATHRRRHRPTKAIPPTLVPAQFKPIG